MRPTPTRRYGHLSSPRPRLGGLAALGLAVGLLLAAGVLPGLVLGGPPATAMELGADQGPEASGAAPAGVAGTDALLPLPESFEAGLFNWTVTGNVDILVANDLTRTNVGDGNDPAPTDGDRFLLLCNGPDEVGTVDGNIDGDADNNDENDVASISQTFTLSAAQVPATLSFDWNFMTAESDGTVIPDPYDDIFNVTLASGGAPILSGSVPGGGNSPYPDVPVDGVEIDVTGGFNTRGCSFEWGQSGFRKFQRLLTAPGMYTLEFLVADQGTDDFFIDSGLLIDNIRIDPEVDMVVTKVSRPDPAIAGEALFYEVTVTNQGRGRANDVVVTDTLPAGVTYISANAPPTPAGILRPAADPACREVPVAGSGVVECDLGTFGPGETKRFTIQVEIDVDLVTTGVETLTNTVVVDSFEIDADDSDNTFQQVAFLDDLADLRLFKASLPIDTIRAGEVYTYTLIVENLGPSSARVVTLDDTILSDQTLTLVDVILDPARASDACVAAPAAPPQSGQVLRCTLGEPLEPVGSGLGTGRWTIQIEARAVETSDVDNEARVYTVDVPATGTPGTPDPDLSNNVVRDAISILDTSDLALSKTAVGAVHSPVDCDVVTLTPNAVTAGDRLTITLSVTNTIPPFGAPGGSTATNVVVQDFLPAGVEVVSVAGVGPGGAAGCVPGTPGNPEDPATCNVGTLAAGQSATMTVVVLVDHDYVGNSGTNLIQHGARTTSDNIDPDLSDNLADPPIAVTEVADVAVTKESRPDPAIAGTALSYEINVVNNGPSTAREVIVRDQLPPEVEFRSARIENLAGREQCTYYAGAHQVVCSLFDLAPGEPPVGGKRVFINTIVRADVLPASITNTVTADTTQTPDCDPLNNTAVEATQIETQADVAIDKESEPTKVFAGEQKRYRIKVTNLGPSWARDVTVYDVLPDEVEYEIDTNQPMCTQPPNLVGFRAVMDGASEVPPNASGAMGLATFILDTATNQLTYSIQLAGTITGVTASHIHLGAAGVNGPVQVLLYGGPPPVLSPTEPFVGTVTIAPALAAAIQANPAAYYVNVHSTAFPGGQVRGQLAETVNAPLLCQQGDMEPVSPLGPYGYRDPDDQTGMRTFYIWARVRPEIPAGTTITNVAIVTSTTSLGDPDVSNNVDASKNLVLSKADLKVTKFGKNDGQVRAGQILTYTVIVDNLGPSWAEGVALKDILQAGEEFDLIDITSDRPTSCTSLANGATETNAIAATPWPPVLPPPPFFGVIEPTGIPEIDQRLEVDCTLTDVLNAEFGASQLAVLTADGPPNSGRWIITMRVRFRQAQDIDNIADVVTTSEEPNTANNHAEVEHEITDVADLSIVKTAVGEVQAAGQPGLVYNMTAPAPPFPQAPNYTTSPTRATAGRRIRYTLRIQNAGPSEAENVLVTDRFPPNVTLIPGSLSVVIDDLGPLPAGACQTGTPGVPTDRFQCGLGTLLGVDNTTRRGATITYDVLVDPSVPAGAVLENDAFVTSDVFDPFNQNNHAHAQTVIDTFGDLSTSKTAMGQNVIGFDVPNQRFIFADLPNQVTAGLMLRYEISVQNNGPSDSNNVTLEDTLPDGVTFLRADGAECRPDTINANVLYCTVGDLPVGARRTFDIYVAVDPSVPDGTVIQNCVTALASPATPPAQPPPLPPPPPTLPLTADPFLPNNTACNDTTVLAVADGGGPDGLGAGTFIEKHDVPAEPRLDRAIEPDLALAGLEHRYEIRFGNSGPSTAVNVVITDTLDFKQPGIRGEIFVRCEVLDPDDAVTCSYDPVTNIVTLESLLSHNEPIFVGGMGTLTVGSQYGFALIALVDPGYVLDASNTMPAAGNSEPGAIARNTVYLSSTTTDFRLQNNQDTERTRIIAEADLSLTKTDNFTDDFLTCDPVVPGGMITWVLEVSNDGPSDAADVYVVDNLPAGFVAVDPDQVMVDVEAGEVVEVRDDGRLTIRVGNDPNNEGDPELGRVNVGSTVAITVQVMVRLEAECGGLVANRARVETRRNDVDWPPVIVGPPQGVPPISPTEPRTPTLDPDPSNNAAIEGTTIECPSIAIDKTISFNGLCPGRDVPQINQVAQPVTFCFEITNTGTTFLDTIMITDTLDTRTTMPTIIFTDTITFGADLKVPLAPGATVTRSVTVPHLTKECGVVDDIVEVSANPVNSGRTDLSCLPIVTDTDAARIEVPCVGVDFRLQLPAIDNETCSTWVAVQNVGDQPVIPLLVAWGDAGFCPPQAAGPLKAECGGLLRPGSAWRFAAGQVPVGARSAVVYSFSAEPIEVQPGTDIPFGALVCDRVFFRTVGDYLEWVRFDTAYRNRGHFEDLDFGTYLSEPIAVSVNRTCPDPTDPGRNVSAAYIGVSSDLEGAYDPRSGGYAFYAPLVFSERGGLTSKLHLQNSGMLCSSLELWFYSQDNCLRPTLGDVLTLAPGESIVFDPSAVVGTDWQGSAWIRATVPLGVVVDTFGPNHFTSYNGYPADVFDLNFTLGNQINFAPLTYSEYQGWDTAIQVQNLSGTTPAKVKAYFLDKKGGIITTLVDWICPRGSQTYFLPVIAGLPGTSVGSARVESQDWLTPGSPAVDPPRILSVVLLEKWADPARTMRREAVAYNAHTECILYDWQLGSNKGGTASGSAVFAIPLIAKAYDGVTSEVAITNVVPKPGFTDFAIYLYDQNGRIDVICQKLNEKAVEYVDVNTWGWIPNRYMGSMVVSAVFWEHEVWDAQGGFVRNLVGLGGVAVERVGGTLAGGDVPGDESKAFEAFPIFDHFDPEQAPDCPGVGGR